MLNKIGYRYDHNHVAAAGVSNGGLMAAPIASRYSIYTHAMLYHAMCAMNVFALPASSSVQLGNAMLSWLSRQSPAGQGPACLQCSQVVSAAVGNATGLTGPAAADCLAYAL